MKKVLVYGATGDQGLPLLRSLLAAGLTVRAATREPSTFPTTEFSQVEVVAASFDNPESLRKASKGVDAIAMNLPFSFDRAYCQMMGENISRAAKESGVRKIVFNTSCVIASKDNGLPAHDGRRDIEAAISSTGLEWASLRSVVFMDNMIRPWVKPSIVNHGVYPYPAKDDLKISFVCLEDVAAYMTAAVLEDRVTAHTFDIGGPEALTGHEAAERLSLAVGREVCFKSLHPDEFARGMAKLVTGSDEVPAGSIWDRMADFYRWYNSEPISPLIVDLSPALGLLPVRPTPLLVWAKSQVWH
jgi:NAD(P)H dehydrogenase (quinone)